MNLLPLDALGARESTPGVIQFGFILPGLTAANGYAVTVRVSHSLDLLVHSATPVELPLTEAPPIGGYDAWTGSVTPSAGDTDKGPHWGEPGQYVYCLTVTGPGGVVVNGISDPFAREFATGDLSAITLGYVDYKWTDQEASWRTPVQSDLIVYELMIAEFGTDIPGVIAKLAYLRDLGINCIELMPVTNVPTEIDWGYDPIGYFGIDERFGNHRAFKALVDECHQRGIAVITDMVFGQTSTSFAYQSLYYQLGLESPTNDPGGQYGPALDFTKPLTQDIAFTANVYWLDRFHVDGFRYDEVGAYWDGPTGEGFAALAYNTYQTVKSKLSSAKPGYWARFGAPTALNLIQCAEYLLSAAVLEGSYATATWQDGTLIASRNCAANPASSIDDLGMSLVGFGFPIEHVNAGNTIQQAPFQYLESHDHERLLCAFNPSVENNPCGLAGQANWARLQPYLIGLLTSVGVPMLWEGEEIGEDYFVPNADPCREQFRPVHWQYLFQVPGSSLLALVRKLTRIRMNGEQFRTGASFYQSGSQWSSNGLLLFSRYNATQFSLVALNFTNETQTSSFPFTIPGAYREELGGPGLAGVVAGADTQIVVPSNYGCIWTAGAEKPAAPKSGKKSRSS